MGRDMIELDAMESNEKLEDGLKVKIYVYDVIGKDVIIPTG